MATLSGMTSDESPALHLIKLCVGSDGPEALAAWQTSRIAEWRAAGLTSQPRHVTRMWPRRAAEIAGRGSLFWVFRGVILIRQPIAGFEAVRGEDGIARCAILFEPALIPVSPRPRRAFQGWRYLPATEAPPDLVEGAFDLGVDPSQRLPDALALALNSIGVV
ncbi:MAG: DUF1489 domain-containing protein [Pseudomonadota bacterium]